MQQYRNIFAPADSAKRPHVMRGMAPKSLVQFGQGLQQRIPAIRVRSPQGLLRTLVRSK